MYCKVIGKMHELNEGYSMIAFCALHHLYSLKWGQAIVLVLLFFHCC